MQFVARGDEIKIFGDDSSMDAFQTAMKQLEKMFLKSKEINEHIVLEALEGIEVSKPENAGDAPVVSTGDVLLIGTRGQQIKARTRNQVKMVNAARKNDIVFAIGPAGTGKTYTAVAIAVLALKEREIRRIILTRPAVEAGENLGFLPGDLKEKIDPYLRPLYDALEDMMPMLVLTLDRRTVASLEVDLRIGVPTARQPSDQVGEHRLQFLTGLVIGWTGRRHGRNDR